MPEYTKDFADNGRPDPRFSSLVDYFEVVDTCRVRPLCSNKLHPGPLLTGQEDYIPTHIDASLMLAQVAKYTCPQHLLNTELRATAMSALQFWFGNYVESGVVSIDDAYALLKLDKNPGHPFNLWVQTKGEALASFAIKHYLDEALLCKGPLVCYTTMKAELRPRSKVLSGKTRMFMPQSIVAVWLGNYLYTKQNDSIVKSCGRHPATIGLEVPGFQMTNIFLSIPDGWTIFEFDVSGMDSSFNLDLALVIRDFRSRYLPAELVAAHEYLYSSVYTGFVNIMGWICRVCGQRSGWTNTMVDNTLHTVLAMSLAWQGIVGSDWSEMRNHVYLKTTGDDGLFAVSPKYVGKFNIVTVSSYWRQVIGQVIESPSFGTLDKSACVFLSCSLCYRYVPMVGGVVPMSMPNISKLLSAFGYIKSDVVEDQLSKYVALLILIYPSEEHFDAMRQRVRAWVKPYCGSHKVIDTLVDLMNDDVFMLRVNLGVSKLEFLTTPFLVDGNRCLKVSSAGLKQFVGKVLRLTTNHPALQLQGSSQPLMSNRKVKGGQVKNSGPNAIGQIVGSHVTAPAASEKVDKILDAANPYLQTLKHPGNVHGVKIPDGAYEGSATFTEVTRIVTSVSSYGCAAVSLGLPQIDVAGAVVSGLSSLIPCTARLITVTNKGMKDPPRTTTDYAVQLGYTGGSSCQIGDLFPSGLAAVAHPSSAIIPAQFKALRLVSAGCRVTVASALATSQGFVTVAFLPKGNVNRPFWQLGTALPLSDVQMLPHSVVMPVNSMGQGMHGIYAPLDNSNFEYVVSRQLCDTGTAPNVGDPWVQHIDVGAFIVALSGAEEGVQMMVEVICNFEAIPLLNSFLGTTSPSVSDPLALSEAMNHLQGVSRVGKGSNGFDGVSEGTHPVLDHVDIVSCFKPGEQPSNLKVSGGLRVFSKSQVTKKGGGSSGSVLNILSKFLDGDGGSTTTIERIMSMILPLLEKAAPALLGMFL